MNKKEWRHQYYLTHREKVIAQVKAWNTAHQELHRKRSLDYYYSHKNERLAYYYAHKEEIKKRIRQNVISYTGYRGSRPDIKNVTKDPYPENKQCRYCGKSNRKKLDWHHWDNANPSDGAWLCCSCHMHINRLLSFARENINELIANLKSQLITP